MKAVLAFFFLFIFSFMTLPVKEIGKVLFDNVLTEENLGGMSDIEKPFKKIKYSLLQLRFYSVCKPLLGITRGFERRRDAKCIIIQHFPEIATPPPNIG